MNSNKYGDAHAGESESVKPEFFLDRQCTDSYSSFAK